MIVGILVGIFCLGYVFIATEDKTKIDKSIPSLLMGTVLWAIVSLTGTELTSNQTLSHHIGHHTQAIAQIIFFAIGAMSIVKALEERGSFDLIKKIIRSDNQIHLMWIVTLLTFIFSAILDNMTTTIVMIAVLSKLLSKKGDRMVFAVIVVIASNAGGAWSPIGDITTTMLWIAGKVTPGKLVSHVLLPSIIQASFVPCFFTLFPKKLSRLTEGVVELSVDDSEKEEKDYDGKKTMLIVGILALIFVPIFKVATHLPPYMGMMFSLSIVGLVNEHYNKKAQKISKHSVDFHELLAKVEWKAVFFFIGILLCVSAFESISVNGHSALEGAAGYLSKKMPLPVFGTLLGVLSAIIDNIPLVFSSISMFKDIPVDNWFWHFIAYTSGTGGSILIIGSASGVIAGSSEDIHFFWYMKKFSFLILCSYLAGVAVFLLQLKASS
jgi:Na+/H+ antiporter NhaD/arsenite permease-like protein